MNQIKDNIKEFYDFQTFIICSSTKTKSILPKDILLIIGYYLLYIKNPYFRLRAGSRKIVILGGVDYNKSTHLTNLIYDSTKNKIEYFNSRLYPHGSDVILLDDRTLFVTGGSEIIYRGERYLNKVYSIDIKIDNKKNKTQKVLMNTTYNNYFHKSLLLNDNKILVIGTSDTNTSYGEIYDRYKNSWTAITNKFKNQCRGCLTCCLLKNGLVMIIGSWNPINNIISICEYYDPENDTFYFAPNLLQNRIHHSAIVLQDDRILVIGGWEIIPGGVLNTCEIFSLETNKWERVSNMKRMRASHTSNLLSDGRVFVCGGTDKTEYERRRSPNLDLQSLKTCEIYNPKTDTWEDACNLPDIRIFHKAVNYN